MTDRERKPRLAWTESKTVEGRTIYESISGYVRVDAPGWLYAECLYGGHQEGVFTPLEGMLFVEGKAREYADRIATAFGKVLVDAPVTLHDCMKTFKLTPEQEAQFLKARAAEETSRNSDLSKIRIGADAPATVKRGECACGDKEDGFIECKYFKGHLWETTQECRLNEAIRERDELNREAAKNEVGE